MSTRYPGGLITKTPVVPAGPFEDGAAPGVWTLDQQLQAQKTGIWPTAGLQPNFIEDVFSTYLYTGNRPTGQSIPNGVDLAGKGGLVWLKARTEAASHGLFDSARGVSNGLYSNRTDAQFSYPSGITSFNSDGFTLGSDASGFINVSGNNYASWTFRKQPKFFDVVTYTGDGVAGRTVAHNLGSVPGMIIVKSSSNDSAWNVYHRSLANTQYMVLNTTAAVATGATRWNSTTPTDSVFSLGTEATVNASGRTYVAYLFAHDAGGFGLTGTDNVISCGSYLGNGDSDGPTVSLGWEPQFIVIKNTGASEGDWYLADDIRGMPVRDGDSKALEANTSDSEAGNSSFVVTSTGFKISANSDNYNGLGETYIYLAIRRGPMKVPTDATKMFTPVAYTGTNVDNRLVDTGIVTDMTMARIRTESSNGGFYTVDRLYGNVSTATALINTGNNDPDSFMSPTVLYGTPFSAMNGFGVGNDTTRKLNQSSTSQLAYAFRRAPGFFDVVCYVGTAANKTEAHNLSVVPELIIVKAKTASAAWQVYSSALANTEYLVLNTTAAKATGATRWNSTTPTSSVFSLGTAAEVNTLSQDYVAYLFATVAGVSKVGSYTGTGTTQTINCGFTAGARFVLIKRTNSTGDWYVWDSARGIVAGNDPYLLLNSTAAEVTNTDYVDTAASGFELSSTAPAAINASGGSFIFLAIA